MFVLGKLDEAVPLRQPLRRHLLRVLTISVHLSRVLTISVHLFRVLTISVHLSPKYVHLFSCFVHLSAKTRRSRTASTAPSTSPASRADRQRPFISCADRQRPSISQVRPSILPIRLSISENSMRPYPFDNLFAFTCYVCS